MKKFKLLILIITCVINLQWTELIAQNNFIIGMYGVDYHVSKDANGQIITSQKIGSNYSSWYGVLAEDGVNTCFTYRPDLWDSFQSFKNLITLIKNNNSMKVIDYNAYFFKPYRNSVGGENEYNLPANINNTNAACNYDLCYDNVYSDPTIADYIYGHSLGGEYNAGHSFPFKDILPSNWCDHCNDSCWKEAEVPPQNVSDALAHFYTKRNSLGLSNQKLIYNAAAHGGYIEGFEDTNTIYQPQDYLIMNGVTNLQKPDIFDEGSYFHNQFWEWAKEDGADYPNPRRYYLGKFKSIDFAKRYFKKVISEIDFEQHDDNPDLSCLIYEIHSNPLVRNGNQLWFQSYTSIIHGAMGVVFYSLNDGYKTSNAVDLYNKNKASDGVSADRFQRTYFPLIYKQYLSNLCKELRYLVNQNLLTDDPNSIIYTKTTSSDANGILPASTTYLPSTVAAVDARDISAVNNVPLTTTYVNHHRGEDYGIRYTVRTNGTDIIMIVSNPNPYSVHNVSFNFSDVANSMIRNATSIDVLFDDGNIQDVNNANYKVNRSNSVNTSNTSVLKKYNIILQNHSFNCNFGPFDVKVFKFVSNPLSYNNTWSKVWSNLGSGTIGGVGPITTNYTLTPIDVDGDNAQELLFSQNQAFNSWETILKYDVTKNIWNWYWSNYGNNLIGDWTLSPNDKFYAGDFNNDGKDELLIFSNTSTNVSMYVFANGQWNKIWSNNGSTLFTDSWLVNSGRYFVGDFNGDNQSEILSISTINTWAAMFKFSNNKWNWTWSNNGSSLFTDAWPVNNSYKYFVGNFDGNTTDDLFSISGENNWIIYLYYANNKWNWGGSNNGNNNIASWSLPFSTTDKILTGNIDYDNLSEVMFLQRGTSATSAQTSEYSGATLTKRWSTSDLGDSYINDWPIADESGENTDYYLIKANSNEPSYLLAMRSYGNNDVFLINMYKSLLGTNKSAIVDDNKSSIIGTNNSDLLIYPNPNNGNFDIYYANREEGPLTITLFNNMGQIVYASKWNNDQRKISINCKLPSGIYFYNIRNNVMNNNGKLIIK